MSFPRVLHVTPAVFHETLGVIGGAERYAFELARHMANITPTTLVGFGKTEANYSAGNLQVKVLGDAHYVRGQRLNPLSSAILPLFADYDVLHCHQKHVLVSSLLALLVRMCGKPVFVSDHGGGGWDISAYINTDSWYAAEFHDSDYSRRLIGHGDRKHSYVLYGGVDIDRFSPAMSRDGDKPVVYVGRLLPHKGIDYLIRGLPAGIRLLIIGRATNPEYLAYLKILASGKDVQFVLDASDDVILAALRSALCIVLPSVYTSFDGRYTAVPELLGQTLIEGMACGLPGIATNVASLPEVLEDGVSGFLVPPNDPEAIAERLRQFQSSPQLAEEMGRRARQRVLERFTWPAVTRKCLELYGV